jgi:hypothetical protein
MGNRPYDYGCGMSNRSPKRTEIQGLCDEMNNARWARNAARIALDNCQWRFEQAVIAVDKFNLEQEKCSCAPVCSTCGKEK